MTDPVDRDDPPPRQRPPEHHTNREPGFRPADDGAADLSGGPIRILMLAANPHTTPRLALYEEARAVTEKLRLSQDRDGFDLITCWAVRPDDLLQYLNQHRPHIVHFSGRGNIAGEITLTTETGTQHPVSTDVLADLFGTMTDNVRVVVLNAGYSAVQAQAISAHIDYVVGMHAPIDDRAATVFAAAFYSALGFRRTVQQAFNQARVALGLHGLPEHAAPELIIRPGTEIVRAQAARHADEQPPTSTAPAQAEHASPGRTAAPERSRRAGGTTYVFDQVAYDDPAALAAALRANWGEGRRLIAGRSVGALAYVALRDWLLKLDLPYTVRALDGGTATHPDRDLMHVIRTLDPDGPPEFNGRLLDLDHLHQIAKEAAMDTAAGARAFVESVFDQGVLTVCDGATGCDGYAVLDDRWHRTVEQVETRLAELRVPIGAADRLALRAQLLVTALDGQHAAFASAAEYAARDLQAGRQPWFAALGTELARSAGDPALHVTIMISRPWAAQQTSNQITEAERQKGYAAQLRVARRRGAIDRISPFVGLVLGLAGCVSSTTIPIGLVSGPLAIYFGIRARRTPHVSAGVWAVILGFVGFVLTLLMVLDISVDKHSS